MLRNRIFQKFLNKINYISFIYLGIVILAIDVFFNVTIFKKIVKIIKRRN